MTNFIRDVREDVAERDRVYLPLETLRRHGVSEDQILNLEFDDDVAISEGLVRTERLSTRRASPGSSTSRRTASSRCCSRRCCTRTTIG